MEIGNEGDNVLQIAEMHSGLRKVAFLPGEDHKVQRAPCCVSFNMFKEVKEVADQFNYR